jgi:uncharacterized membrane protein
MIRKKLKSKAVQTSKFRLRGLDNTRIEALSDGVFALAIALLLFSTKVPQTFDEIKMFIDDLIPFGITITLLTLIWFEHYTFFVRYGLKGPGIVALNSLLLFLMLFYVYPLKFLFRVLYDFFTAAYLQDSERWNHLWTVVIKPEDAPNLMIIYGIGAAMVFITFILMYWIAFTQREPLELNDLEIYSTKTHIYENVIMAGVPLISALVAYLEIGRSNGDTFMYAGMTYFLYTFSLPLFHTFRAIRMKKLFG